MKLLLDENMPIDLRREIAGNECETVTFRGWNGKRNGELLAAAAETGFDALLTKDTSLPYQQGGLLSVAVVVLRA